MTCYVCGSPLQVDDVAIDTKWPICVRCFARETEKPRVLSQGFRRDLDAVLKSVFAADWWDKS